MRLLRYGNGKLGNVSRMMGELSFRFSRGIDAWYHSPKNLPIKNLHAISQWSAYLSFTHCRRSTESARIESIQEQVAWVIRWSVGTHHRESLRLPITTKTAVAGVSCASLVAETLAE